MMMMIKFLELILDAVTICNIFRTFIRRTTLVKIVGKLKNNCKYKKKQLYFLIHPILNNVPLVENERLV
jgi:hypothetical protein